MRKRRNKTALHPIMTFSILIISVVILSGVLSILGVSTNYNMINASNGSFYTDTVSVQSLFNLSGIKTVFSTTVSNFVGFAPLSMLLITLIGIGIMDKSGFLESFFTLLTKNAKKTTITFILSLITVVSSIIGDMSYIVLIPIIALLFKYSKRNPKAGIVLAFAGISSGIGINLVMSSIESSLLTYTELAASSMDASYSINTFSYIFIMMFLTVLSSFIITYITENITIPKVGKYELDGEETEIHLDRRKKRGLLFSLTIASIYLIIFIYNIIPGLPFSGNLLDYSQNLYIDKLFGYNSFFNQGFVFIVTMLFFLCGLFYGIGAKTIKNNQDISNFLGHSLDGIGKTIVLIFFASTLISITKETNIGSVFTALIANFLAKNAISGIPLILIAFFLVGFLTLFLPSSISSWAILSGVFVPVFMNAGMTPEFAELVFKAGSSMSYGLTPLMAYFVIYLAFLDNYSDEENPITLFNSIKYVLPYSMAMMVVWIATLIVFYIMGIPLGIGASAIL